MFGSYRPLDSKRQCTKSCLEDLPHTIEHWQLYAQTRAVVWHLSVDRPKWRKHWSQRLYVLLCCGERKGVGRGWTRGRLAGRKQKKETTIQYAEEKRWVFGLTLQKTE